MKAAQTPDKKEVPCVFGRPPQLPVTKIIRLSAALLARHRRRSTPTVALSLPPRVCSLPPESLSGRLSTIYSWVRLFIYF